MRNDLLQDLAVTLAIDNPERLWGVSPESTYAALDAVATDKSLLDALEGYHTLALAATNQERERDILVDFHREFLRAVNLVADGEVTEIGALVLRSNDSRALLQTLVATHSEATRRVLRDCLAIEDIVPRREYETLLRDNHEIEVLTPVFGSFNLLRMFPDGVELSVEAVERSLKAHDIGSEEAARASLHRSLLRSFSGFDAEVAEEITAQHLGRRGRGMTEQAIVATLGDADAERFDYEAVRTAIDEARAEYDRLAARSVDLLTAGGGDVTVTSGEEITVEDVREHAESDTAPAIIDLFAMVVAQRLDRVHARYVASQLDVSLYPAFNAINSVPGVECELQDEVLVLDQVPTVVGGTSHYDRYVEFLLDERETFASRRETLAESSITLEGVDVDAHLVTRISEIESRQVAPTYFAFTLIDPDALGQEVMEEYVGDSRGLGRERARLRRWHGSRPSDLRSYTAMTDRLFSRGLESNLDQQVLRVMTPYDDDTFAEYAAQLRRLLEAGHELRFLTRHTKEPWEWKRLRDNLLKPLDANREQVSIRTYSRFKQHQRITPETDRSQVSEVGIHGKLHIIGGPHEGAALLGSANFMENSYHWNPECGVYTERTAFVRAATEFFDVVWDLAEADQLSLNRLQEIPDREFIPSYYTS